MHGLLSVKLFSFTTIIPSPFCIDTCRIARYLSSSLAVLLCLDHGRSLWHGFVVVARHGHFDDAARSLVGIAQRAVGKLGKEIHAARHRSRQGVLGWLLSSHPLDDGTHRQGGGDRRGNQHPHGKAGGAHGDFTIVAVGIVRVGVGGVSVGTGICRVRCAFPVAAVMLGHAFVVRWTNRGTSVMNTFYNVGCVEKKRKKVGLRGSSE